MIVALDIGNSNIVLAIEDNGEFIHTFRIFTDTKKTGDEYYAILNALLEDEHIDRSKIEKSAISSVVPFITRSFEKNMKRLFGTDPLVISNEVETGLNRDSIPLELGSDLLSNASYAHRRFPDKNVMVVDFGTAITTTTVDKTGSIRGVTIAPGLVTSVNALFGSTAQLPQVDLKVPKTILGRDSMGSIRAGIMYGFSGLVERIIKETERELDDRLTVIATGGLSSTISPLIDRFDFIDQFHTLRGITYISSLNDRNKKIEQ